MTDFHLTSQKQPQKIKYSGIPSVFCQPRNLFPVKIPFNNDSSIFRQAKNERVHHQWTHTKGNSKRGTLSYKKMVSEGKSGMKKEMKNKVVNIWINLNEH